MASILVGHETDTGIALKAGKAGFVCDSTIDTIDISSFFLQGVVLYGQRNLRDFGSPESACGASPPIADDHRPGSNHRVPFLGRGHVTESRFNHIPGRGDWHRYGGWFTIDYTASDTDPSVNVGSYSSPLVGFRGTIGSSSFASSLNAGNTVRVVDGLDGMPGLTDDWTILQVVPAGGLAELSLTFHDSAGQALSGQSIPESSTAFSAFPDVVLYARHPDGPFGQYRLNLAITQVPEPSVAVLITVSLAACGVIFRQRRLSLCR